MTSLNVVFLATACSVFVVAADGAADTCQNSTVRDVTALGAGLCTDAVGRTANGFACIAASCGDTFSSVDGCARACQSDLGCTGFSK